MFMTVVNDRDRDHGHDAPHDAHDDGRDRGGGRNHDHGRDDDDRDPNHRNRDGDGAATTSNRTDHKDGNSTKVGLLLVLPARRKQLVPMQKKQQA